MTTTAPHRLFICRPADVHAALCNLVISFRHDREFRKLRNCELHNSKNEEYSRLGRDSLWSAGYVAWLTLRQFGTNQHVPPKFQWTSAALTGAKYQKIALFKVGSAFFQLQGTFRTPLVQYISISCVKMHPLPSLHQRHLLKNCLYCGFCLSESGSTMKFVCFLWLITERDNRDIYWQC
jgi:hypothetical protein